jgi:hypothetical protein
MDKRAARFGTQNQKPGTIEGWPDNAKNNLKK